MKLGLQVELLIFNKLLIVYAQKEFLQEFFMNKFLNHCNYEYQSLPEIN